MSLEFPNAGGTIARRVGLKAMHKVWNGCCKSIVKAIGGHLLWPLYQNLAQVVRPITTVTMRQSNEAEFQGDLPQVNEKHEAWIGRSYRWWNLYRSISRAWSLLSRMHSLNAAAW